MTVQMGTPVREKVRDTMDGIKMKATITDNALYAAKHLECIQPVNDEGLSEDEVEQSDSGMQMG